MDWRHHPCRTPRCASAARGPGRHGAGRRPAYRQTQSSFACAWPRSVLDATAASSDLLARATAARQHWLTSMSVYWNRSRIGHRRNRTAPGKMSCAGVGLGFQPGSLRLQTPSVMGVGIRLPAPVRSDSAPPAARSSKLVTLHGLPGIVPAFTGARRGCFGREAE